ncbi:MAG: RNA polymerase factor sigma-54 [Bacteroidia bacterium]|nr:RNA polymerase factor sigma-54 [Bacteroidia bacterium]MDW8157916.1 RNA polymerase factor sigma-54 [Bacteroidia bacterium]
MSNLKQSTALRLSQRPSFQQIQYIKLLQIPTAALEARIEEELENNPALEEINELSKEKNAEEDIDFENPTGMPTNNSEESKNQEDSLEELLNQEDYSYKTSLEDDPDEERRELPIVQMSTLYDSLMSQIHLLEMDERQLMIAEEIIGDLDEDGYLRRPLVSIADDLGFKYNLQVSEQEVEEVLYKVQELDPAGIGARDLRECLLLQLNRKMQSEDTLLAFRIIDEFFEEYKNKHFDKILDKLQISEQAFKRANAVILKLNPKPGESQTEVKLNYIIPDFILHVENNQIQIKLNRKNAPELRINPSYIRMYEHLQANYKKKNGRVKAEDLQFIKSKIESAKWFIDAIKQRQITLHKTMECIAQEQKEFFLSEGDETKIKPLILKDIAEKINMDISTVSRVANSKYVQTDFGIYQLKHFFSEGIVNQKGEEVSNREVKQILKEIIENEDKKNPYSDDKLTEILRQKGYNIARRTVAKYREQMGINVARLRKQL